MSIINYFIWLDYYYEIQFARTKHNKHVTLLLKKLSYCPLHVPPHNGHLSTTTTFICPQGGLCGEVGLYVLKSMLFLRPESWSLFLVKLRNLYSKSLAAEPSKNLLMNYLLVTLFTRNEGCTFVTETGSNWFLLR